MQNRFNGFRARPEPLKRFWSNDRLRHPAINRGANENGPIGFMWLPLLTLSDLEPNHRFKTLQESLEYWGNNSKFAWISLALGACLVLGVIAGFCVRPWLQRRQQRLIPLRTFRQLADELGISTRDQALLIRIAKQQALPSPLTLILSGATLKHHVQRYGQTLSRSDLNEITRQVDALERDLFGPMNAESVGPTSTAPSSTDRERAA